MPTYGAWEDTVLRAHLRPRRVHLAAHLPQQLRPGHAGLPRQRRPDGQLHRRGRGDRRCGRRAPPLVQAHHAELRRMERLVPHAAQPRGAGQGGLAGRAADPRGDLQHGGCAGLRRLLHLAAQPCRPREGGVPRAARQRHRADHDRDRRAGLAADDLPSVRSISAAWAAAACCAREIDSPTYAARYNDPQGPINDYYEIPAAPYLKLSAVHDDKGGHA